MTPRPLARSLVPLPQESLPGFLLRLAYRLERSPARIGLLCGLSTMHHRLPADYLLALPPRLADVFAEATRLSSTEAQALTLAGSGLTRTYAPLATTRLDGGRNYAAAQRRWAISLSSRYCPKCLAGDGSPAQSALGGAWKLRWHLPVVFACSEHSMLLSSTCPQCDNLPNRPPGTERSGLLMQRAAIGLHPAQCRHPLLGTRLTAGEANRCCGARLDHSLGSPPAMTPEDLDRVLALQLHLDKHLFAAPPQTTEKDRQFFLDLVAVAHLVKFSWPLGADLVRSTHLSALINSHATPIVRQLNQPLGPGPRSSSPWSAPDDAAQAAALLTAAAELLSHRDEGATDFRDRIQPLARTAFERLTPNLAAGFRRMDFSPVLAGALARKINGFYHAGGHRNPKLRAPSRTCHFGTEHIPALLPTAWSEAHFAELRDRVGPITNWNTRHLRRAASLKLVEMAAGGTWPECAEALGMPWTTAQQSLKILKRVLDPLESWASFDRAVEQVAYALDSDPHRIDYAIRRRTLSSWHLSDTAWGALCDGFKTLRGGPTSPSPTAATALLWARVTQGDYLHSPVLNALRNSGRDTTPVVASVNQLLQAAYRHRGEKGLLVKRLEHYGGRLALACDQARGSQDATDTLLIE
ncbi:MULTISPECIES: TniQ family protein [unclassified Streptomyces]|uniref:TniQ family protein n=1 Tax=unclassified Streptomyces TaxID=2593676 RepID=UPI0036B32C17